ncbi:MAG: D-cysteine desulfhydrase family protein [Calditrichaeota bacterium]|nr:MAG: D-cysteine desulfhydrase family protein [Calditrichota bacterium]
MKIDYIDRLQLAHLPTPVQSLERLTCAFEGPKIWMKRDDYTGVGMSGNKIRKLEFLLADAQKKQADIVITCGGIQSNHARATAVAAAKLGMKSHVVLRGNRTAARDGNLMINLLVDSEITYVTAEEYADNLNIMAALADEYKKQGLNAYVIPEGGSNSLGAWGYIAAMEEILVQLKSANIHIDIMLCAVGSGGTYAGLMLGAGLFEVNFEIWGVNVCDDAPYFNKVVNEIAGEFKQKYMPEFTWPQEKIKIIDGFVGKGYGLSSQEEIDVIKQVAMLEGILIDPVYTGKTMFALKNLIQSGAIAADKNILFWHTGGVFSLFPKRDLFF